MYKAWESENFQQKTSFLYTMNVNKLKSTTMNTSPPSQNPNFDNLSCFGNDPLYFDIASYLLSDEDFGSNDNVSFESKGGVDCPTGSFSAVPFVENM